MPEGIEGVTNRLAALIGTREVVRKPKPVESAVVIGAGIKEAVSFYRNVRKYSKGELNEEDMQKATEQTRTSLERAAAMRQGTYERDSKSKLNPLLKTLNQKIYEEKVAEPLVNPFGDTINPETVNSLDIIHEIANFENGIYDKLMSRVLKEQRLLSISDADPKEAEEIKKEVESRMDGVVRSIGLNFIRSQIPNIGKYFMDKATKSVQEYTPKK